MIECNQCGEQNEDGTEFCASCGTYVAWKDDDDPDQPAPRPTSEPTKDAAGPGASASAATSDVAVADPTGDVSTHPPAEVVIRETREASPGVDAGRVDDEVQVKGNTSSTDRSVASDVTAGGGAPIAADVETDDTTRPDIGSRGPGREKIFTQPDDRREIEEEPQPGDVICEECGAGNRPGREFCRECGNELSEEVVVEEHVPWWRRLFRRRARRPADPRRPQRRRVSARSVLTVLVILAGLSFAIPQVREWALDLTDRGRKTVAPEYRVVAVSGPSAAASTSAKGRKPGHAFDRIHQTYWAEAADGDGAGQWVSIKFERPVDVAYMIISTGASSTPQSFPKQPRPSRILVVFPGGPDPIRLDLADTPDPQRFNVRADAVSSVGVLVEEVFPPIVGKGSSAAIADIEFFSRE